MQTIWISREKVPTEILMKNSWKCCGFGLVAVDNFDFTRKIVKKIWVKNSWNCWSFVKIEFLDKNLTFRIVCAVLIQDTKSVTHSVTKDKTWSTEQLHVKDQECTQYNLIDEMPHKLEGKGLKHFLRQKYRIKRFSGTKVYQWVVEQNGQNW